MSSDVGTGSDRRTRSPPVAAVAVVALAAAVAAALGIGVPATFDAHVAVDETQYLLTAISLGQDGDLDISDELAERRWRAFADVEPPVQTAARADGQRISPHDPLLAALLAVPVLVGGFLAAKLALSLLAGMLAGLMLWVAVRRFAVPLPLAVSGVGLAAASAPLAVYGQQLYPELPAALATVVAVAVLTGPPRSRSLVVLVVAVTALAWLSVKYVPVAGVLVVLGALRWWRAGHRGQVLAGGAALAGLGVVHLVAHRVVWGGWTVYSSGDHFEDTGEFSVVGLAPDYPGRSVRLTGLLVDQVFGLAAWQPAWLLVVPAVAALLARRPRGLAALLAPLAVGWLVATFVALTMHGFWWPGRQVVVVAPLAVLAVLCWLARRGLLVRLVAAALAAAGVLSYGWLLADGYAGRLTWVFGFETTGSPVYRLLSPLLPDYRNGVAEFWPAHLAWTALLGALAIWAWRSPVSDHALPR